MPYTKRSDKPKGVRLRNRQKFRQPTTRNRYYCVEERFNLYPVIKIVKSEVLAHLWRDAFPQEDRYRLTIYKIFCREPPPILLNDYKKRTGVATSQEACVLWLQEIGIRIP